jgi:hypothetical protein
MKFYFEQIFYLNFQKNPKNDKGRSNFLNTTPSTKYHFIQGLRHLY